MSTRTTQRRPRVAVLATGGPTSIIKGGAERFYLGLKDALVDWGADAVIHWEVSDETNFEAIKQSYLRFYDLNLSAYDAVISTKAPGYLVRHRNHVCYLQHTMRVFYDMFDTEFSNADPSVHAQRRLIHTLDTEALKIPRTRSVFSIGHTVKNRLAFYNRVQSEVLYQASTVAGLHCGASRYLFLPGRLHRWKRVGLAIEAMRHVKVSIPLLIAGVGEDENLFRELAGSDPRIRFLGRVSDSELVQLYADALAVLFVPLQEDFGLITLEAFLSSKPVITCEDSGEPAIIVRDSVSGFVSPPSAVALAERIEQIVSDPARSAAMGRIGHDDIRSISWKNVAQTLMSALGYEQPSYLGSSATK